MIHARDAMTHVAPRRRHRIGYTKLSYCPKCNVAAHREDMPPAEPCHKCGGKVADNLSGKWEHHTGSWFTTETGEWLFTIHSHQLVKALRSDHHADVLKHHQGIQTKTRIRRANASVLLDHNTLVIDPMRTKTDLDFTK